MIDPDDGRPWVFSKVAKRKIARRLLRESRPTLLIGLPMCTAFPTWQELNYAKSDGKGAFVHTRFVASFYHEQIDVHCYFLHEHSKFPCVKTFERMPNVGIAMAINANPTGRTLGRLRRSPQASCRTPKKY